MISGSCRDRRQAAPGLCQPSKRSFLSSGINSRVEVKQSNCRQYIFREEWSMDYKSRDTAKTIIKIFIIVNLFLLCIFFFDGNYHKAEAAVSRYVKNSNFVGSYSATGKKPKAKKPEPLMAQAYLWQQLEVLTFRLGNGDIAIRLRASCMESREPRLPHCRPLLPEEPR